MALVRPLAVLSSVVVVVPADARPEGVALRGPVGPAWPAAHHHHHHNPHHAVDVDVDVGVDRDAFCADLSALESHMTRSLADENGRTYDGSFDCGCVDLDDESFGIECSMDTGEEVVLERAAFEMIHGAYRLTRTSWGYEDSEAYAEEQEVFHFRDGRLRSCEAHGCDSCKVCSDGRRIGVDCRNVAPPRQWYRYTCRWSDYRGSFSNTFDFGTIRAGAGGEADAEGGGMTDEGDEAEAEEEEEEEAEIEEEEEEEKEAEEEVSEEEEMSSPDPDAAGEGGTTEEGDEVEEEQEKEEEETSSSDPAAADDAVGWDEFCSSHLSSLALHMTSAFQERMGRLTHAAGFECGCIEAPGAYAVNCDVEGTDGDDVEFVASELLYFESDEEGRLELVETSWRWEADGAALPNQGVFAIANGKATGCTANGCGSCEVCDDGASVAVAECGVVAGETISRPPGIRDRHGWGGDEHGESSQDGADPLPGLPASCVPGFTGGLSHSFDFGPLAADNDVAATGTASTTAIGASTDAPSSPDETSATDAPSMTTKATTAEVGSTIESTASTDAPSSPDGVIDRDEFCQSLTALESHMTKEFEKREGEDSATDFECSCDEPDDDGAFSIECSAFNDGGVATFLAYDLLSLELNGAGRYRLRETSWIWEDAGGARVPNGGAFRFEDGTVAGCRADGCTSCAVCDDATSIRVECENRPTSECSDGYTGGLSHSFDFGMVAATDDAPTTSTQATEIASTTTTSLPGDLPAGVTDKEGFCENLTGLEAHMNVELMSLNHANMDTDTGRYECACTEVKGDSEAFIVLCSIEGVNVTFNRPEQMLFELNQNEYELQGTSLGWEQLDGSDLPSQEVFVVENGIVVSCEAEICTSCIICDDKVSIAVDCANLEIGGYSYECSDGYKGSFALTFDFGVIVADIDALTTTQATEASMSTTTGASTANIIATNATEPTDATQTTELAATTESNGMLTAATTEAPVADITATKAAEATDATQAMEAAVTSESSDIVLTTTEATDVTPTAEVAATAESRVASTSDVGPVWSTEAPVTNIFTTTTAATRGTVATRGPPDIVGSNAELAGASVDGVQEIITKANSFTVKADVNKSPDGAILGWWAIAAFAMVTGFLIVKE